MKMSLKEGEAYAALRDAVASQIQEMKALCPSHHSIVMICDVIVMSTVYACIVLVKPSWCPLLSNLVAVRIGSKVCLESQEARERERQWLKHQTTGELDENRLVVSWCDKWKGLNEKPSFLHDDQKDFQFELCVLHFHNLARFLQNLSL